MSNRHEAHIAAVLAGRVTRGSGNQWRDQMDVKQHRDLGQYVFACDGKSTIGLSLLLTRTMWEKAKTQAQNLIPVIPLRFYANSRLTAVDEDLAIVDLETLGSLQHDANLLHRIKEQGCLTGGHDLPGVSTCTVCGASAYDMVGAED